MLESDLFLDVNIEDQENTLRIHGFSSSNRTYEGDDALSARKNKAEWRR